MGAPGATALAAMLASLDVERRAGVFGYIETSPGAPPPPGAAAMVTEEHATSWVVALPHPGALFPAAWLTLSVDSSLDAVGLTAAVAGALADAGIPANVLAGVRRDHVLVPVDRADEAAAALRSLRSAFHDRSGIGGRRR